MSSRLTVVWFDPGPETGWCVLQVDDWRAHSDPVLSRVRHWAAGVFFGLTLNENIDEAVELCRLWNEAVYGCEDFHLMTDVRGKEVLAPIKVQAGLTYALWTAGIEIETQMPSEAAAINDDRLRRWGFWVPGAEYDDARSATRHALTFLKKAIANPRIAARAWGGERGDWAPRISPPGRKRSG